MRALARTNDGIVAALQGAPGCAGTAIYVDATASQCVAGGVHGEVSPEGVVAVARRTGSTGPVYGPGFSMLSMDRFDIDIVSPHGQPRTVIHDALSPMNLTLTSIAADRTCWCCGRAVGVSSDAAILGSEQSSSRWAGWVRGNGVPALTSGLQFDYAERRQTAGGSMRIAITAGLGARSETTIDGLAERAQELEARGFAGMWLPNAFGFDAITALAAAGRSTTRIEIGTAVVPTFARHPVVMAQQALTAQDALKGRFTLGIGLSHKVMMEDQLGSRTRSRRATCASTCTCWRRCCTAKRPRSKASSIEPTPRSRCPARGPVPLLVAALAT